MTNCEKTKTCIHDGKDKCKTCAYNMDLKRDFYLPYHPPVDDDDNNSFMPRVGFPKVNF